MAEIYTDYNTNPHFKEREFTCRCPKCKEAYVYNELMEKLTNARKDAKIPFVISSGCRCQERNKNIGGAKNSDHLVDYESIICCGVDILCDNNRNRFTLVKSLLDAGINRLGLAHTFIHAGIDKRNPGNVIWFY
jgi:hypothetical protein